MGKKIIWAGFYFLAMTMISCDRTPKPSETPPTRVEIKSVGTSVLDKGRNYSGTVQESSGTALSFSVAGTIRQMNVSVGDYVVKGQLLATLDAADLRHAYDIAKATLNQAQDAYNRMSQLHEANALPDIKWVEVQNALSQAQSAEAIAKKTLADANLYAPSSGYISEKFADTGMNIAPGIPVVKLVDITSVKVCISVPENEIAGIRGNATAVITVGALDEKSYQGRLVEKGIAANPLSRSYDVKFEVANPDKELLPGMICDVAMSPDAEISVIAVPIDAVFLDADNNNFVWLAQDGKARKRIVRTDGVTAGTRIIVKSGLVAGDSIIVAGQQKVSEGTSIVNISK